MCVCATFQVGLRLLEVNDSSLLGISHDEAVAVMRSAGSTIRLVVCEGYDYSLVSNHSQKISRTPTIFYECSIQILEKKRSEISEP